MITERVPRAIASPRQMLEEKITSHEARYGGGERVGVGFFVIGPLHRRAK